MLPGAPTYLSTKKTSRESPEKKRARIEMANLQHAIENSAYEKEIYDEQQKCINIGDFKKLNLIDISENWTVVHKENSVLFLIIDLNPNPVVNKSIIVHSDLSIVCYFGNVTMDNLGKFHFPFKVTCIKTVESILQYIDSLNSLNVPASSISEEICNMLNKFLVILPPNKKCAVDFIIEQVKLLCTEKHNFRYSLEILILSSLLHSISPHSYKFLRNSGIIIFPHPHTINRLCSKFNLYPLN